ncbi:protein TRC8 homolog [Rhopalosiphum maidis]|uniref:protein TRC8 homolog n=1 Tax=Rhopalosiphum maidis TaxID=43146 RepID=UPI000F00B44D|nr:protein TRC8 homolog [Rhopalosiphum maidis]
MSFCNLLRVPLIFIIDQLFYSSFEFPYLSDAIFPVNSTLSQVDISESEQYYKAFFKIIPCLMFCASLSLLVLNVRYLFILYLQGVSVYVVFYSYWANIQTIEVLSGKYENFNGDIVNEVITWNVDGIIHLFTHSQLYQLFCSIMLQYFLSLVFEFVHVFTTDHSIHNFFKYSFLIPTLVALILKTSNILNTVTMLSTLLQLFVLIKTFWFIVFMMTDLIRDGYNYTQEIINNLGVFFLIETEWSRLNMSSVLRIFWATRVLIHILHMQYIEIKNETLFEAIKYLLIKGNDTFIAVLGMTSFVSYFCDYIGAFFHWVLLVDEFDDISGGIISAILFVMLALQTGITGLDSENRLIKLFENSFLICAILQQYILNMVNELLMFLTASYNISLKRHLRALLVCGFLIVLSVTILIYLWSNHSVSPWLLSVSSLNIVTIIKVLVSLAVYSLLLIDTYCSKAWEKLDDYVYYINSFGNIVEFCSSIFLLLNSIYNVSFVSGGKIRAFIICVQAYSNTCQARTKWEEFTKRSTVMKKIESLSQATNIQLSKFNDVCAICHENMRSARITKCNHYFHGECLRKWFYVNDQCPMCQCVMVLQATE